jgi:cell division protein FtsZ
VLLSIAGGSDLGLFEINEAAAMVADAVHQDANIIFGATIDDALGDEVRVTVIAAGFEGGRPKRRDEGHGLRPRPAQAQKPQTQEETRAAARALAEQRRASEGAPQRREPVTVGAAPQRTSGATAMDSSGPAPVQRPSTPTFDDDELDVPDFLK